MRMHAVLAIVAVPLMALDNGKRIHNDGNAPLLAHAHTVWQIFARGAMPQCVAAHVDGAAVVTQTDVYQRWPDGSVKTAWVHFQASVPAQGSVYVDFRPSISGCDSSGALTLAEMLAFDAGGGQGSWGFRVEHTALGPGDASLTVGRSLRSIMAGLPGLSDDRDALTSRYLFKGPIATGIVVENRTADVAADNGLQWDFGWQCATNCANYSHPLTRWQWPSDKKYKSLHPVWVVVFYPATRRVEVEYRVENLWSMRLQDQSYGVRIFGGSSEADLTYAAPAAGGMIRHFKHPHASRWRKRFVFGPQTGRTRLDHNFPYLISLGLLPQYDLNAPLAAENLAQDVMRYDAASSDRGDIATVGATASELTLGRGTFTALASPTSLANWINDAEAGVVMWPQLRWLYSFSPDLYRVNFGTDVAGGAGNTEVNSHLSYHFREMDTAKTQFCSSCPSAANRAVGAIGRPFSLDARPTGNARTTNSDCCNGNTGAVVADRMVLVGPKSSANLSWDSAHLYAASWPVWVTTGDLWHRDEMQFYASSMLASTGQTSGLSTPPYACSGNNGAATGASCRYQATGWMAAQLRGAAWGMLEAARASYSAPTGSAEEEYFRRKLDNNIGMYEGVMDLRGGAFFEMNTGGTSRPGEPGDNPCPAAGALSQSNSSLWCLGRRGIMAMKPNPLRLLRGGDVKSSFQFGEVDARKASAPVGHYFTYYCLLAWNSIEELGFSEIAPMRRAAMRNIVGPILESPNPLRYEDYSIGYLRVPNDTSVPIEDVTNASGALVTTALPHGLVAGQSVRIGGGTGTWKGDVGGTVQSVPAPDAFTVSWNTLSLGPYSGQSMWVSHNLVAGSGFRVTGAVSGSPAVFTSDRPHGLVVGEQLVFAGGMGSWAAVNGRMEVRTVPNSTTFTLTIVATDGAVNSTGWSAYNGSLECKGKEIAGGTVAYSAALFPSWAEVNRASAEADKRTGTRSNSALGYAANGRMAAASVSGLVDRSCTDPRGQACSGQRAFEIARMVVNPQTYITSNPKYMGVPRQRIEGLAVGVGALQAVVTYTAPTPDACRWAVSTGTFTSSRDDSDMPDGAGSLARRVVLDGLTPSTAYRIRVTCGTVSSLSRGTVRAEADFTTGVEGNETTYRLRLRAPTGRGMVWATVRHGATSALSESVRVPCAGLCVADLPARRGRPLHYRVEYSDAVDRVVASGAVGTVVP